LHVGDDCADRLGGVAGVDRDPDTEVERVRHALALLVSMRLIPSLGHAHTTTTGVAAAAVVPLSHRLLSELDLFVSPGAWHSHDIFVGIVVGFREEKPVILQVS
jgi:hypothetical protein